MSKEEWDILANRLEEQMIREQQAYQEMLDDQEEIE